MVVWTRLRSAGARSDNASACACPSNAPTLPRPTPRCSIVATNIFEVQEGRWKLVHHHGSPAAKVGMM